MAKVEEFLDAVSDIPNKNYGGCLLFCYAFYLWLIKNDLPVEDFQIVQYATSRHCIELNVGWINGIYDEAVSSNHFTWLYDGIEMDSEGEYKPLPSDIRTVLKGLNTTYTDLVEEFCVNALLNGCWNSTFKRLENIPLIEAALDIEFDGRIKE